MRLMITGADGLFGSQMAPLFMNDSFYSEVVLKSVNDFDIRQKKDVIKNVCEIKPDILIHMAAWVDVDGCEKKPQEAMEINYRGVMNITEACRMIDSKLIFISSDYIFDGIDPPLGGYLENSESNPLNVYGKAKRFSEQYIQNMLHNYLIIRTAWLFGGGNAQNSFILKVLDSLKYSNKFYAIVDQVGSPTYSVELGECLCKILKSKDFDSLKGIYHIANTGECSWYDQALKTVEFMYGRTHQYKIIPVLMNSSSYYARRPKYSVLNTDKFYYATGIRLSSWENSLKQYIESLKI
ncbi:MAG: dTDP-4-dehydrorhamnose reductase [Spirochaetales bacterium]|nr:dTDP-4-dehydrorhamnose reductase [Spirochaetales bacterium]